MKRPAFDRAVHRPLEFAAFANAFRVPSHFSIAVMIRPCALAVLMMTISAVAAAQTSAPAGDAAKGREKTRMCEGCHGIEGWRTAYPEVYRVPKLGGQHESYILKALQEYKSGDRSHPSMRAIAGSLSDQDMADLAAYFSKGGVQTASK